MNGHAALELCYIRDSVNMGRLSVDEGVHVSPDSAEDSSASLVLLMVVYLESKVESCSSLAAG